MSSETIFTRNERIDRELRDAWYTLAGRVAYNKHNPVGNSSGLCCELDFLWECRVISRAAYHAMQDTIHDEGERVLGEDRYDPDYTYIWPLTGEGDRKRIEFCLKNAAIIEKFYR